MLKNSFIAILVLIFSVFASQSLNAQNSYFYIEGDLETPIYVKVEGMMMERLGKNFCIIPNLAAGATTFEILFEKNKYPSQTFILNVPENAERGFVLSQIEPGVFALFDMQQKRFIMAGNTAEEDEIVEYIRPVRVKLDHTQGFVKNSPENEGTSIANIKDKIKELGQTKGKGETSQSQQEEDLKFMDNVSINTSSNKAEGIATSSSSSININSDCPEAMNNFQFEAVAARFSSMQNDTERIRILRRGLNKYCFSTEHVRILANNMDTQSGKFELVKMLYAYTSDQEKYEGLESVFDSKFIQSEFRKLIKR